MGAIRVKRNSPGRNFVVNSVVGACIAHFSLNICVVTSVNAQTLRGSFELGTQVFVRDPLFSEQSSRSAAPLGKFRVQGNAPICEDAEVVLSARASVTPSGNDKTFIEVTEGLLQYQRGPYTSKIGVLNEHWGFLDTANPANIFNQLDMVEDYQGDTQLGQAGLSLDYLGEELTLSFLVSPIARERRISIGGDRFRPVALPLLDADFENGETAISGAIRAFFTRREYELAISHFHGTSREPEFIPEVLNGVQSLRPYYRRIDQTALELQYVLGEYVLRMEAAHRTGQSGGEFSSLGVGLERIFFGSIGVAGDLVLFIEGYFDDRLPSAPVTPFQNDISFGARLLSNDTSSSEISARFIVDLEGGGTIAEFRGKRRFSNDLLFNVNLTVPFDTEGDPALSGFRRDQRLQIAVTKFF